MSSHSESPARHTFQWEREKKYIKGSFPLDTCWLTSTKIFFLFFFFCFVCVFYWQDEMKEQFWNERLQKKSWMPALGLMAHAHQACTHSLTDEILCAEKNPKQNRKEVLPRWCLENKQGCSSGEREHLPQPFCCGVFHRSKVTGYGRSLKLFISRASVPLILSGRRACWVGRAIRTVWLQAPCSSHSKKGIWPNKPLIQREPCLTFLVCHAGPEVICDCDTGGCFKRHQCLKKSPQD